MTVGVSLAARSPVATSHFTLRNHNMKYNEKLRNREKRRWIAQQQADKQLLYQQRQAHWARTQQERQRYMTQQHITSAISTPVVRRSPPSQPQYARFKGPTTFPNWRRSRIHSSSPPPDHSVLTVDCRSDWSDFHSTRRRCSLCSEGSVYGFGPEYRTFCYG